MTEAQTAHERTIPAKDRLIVALDVSDRSSAMEVIDRTAEYAGIYKVGLQLFTAAGPALVRELCESGRKIFLDLKFHDIPNTAAKAGVEAARLGVWMFNVHAAGGNEMMRKTVIEVSEFCGKSGLTVPKMIAVTVLTSSADDAPHEIGIEGSAAAWADRLASLSAAAGMDGVVASAHDAARLRQTLGPERLIVTPGIRNAGASIGDQRRVMSVSQALRAGADHLVVGRPITSAGDMTAAARAIFEEIQSVCNEI